MLACKDHSQASTCLLWLAGENASKTRPSGVTLCKDARKLAPQAYDVTSKRTGDTPIGCLMYSVLSTGAVEARCCTSSHRTCKARLDKPWQRQLCEHENNCAHHWGSSLPSEANP